ncbi:MAG TPA: tetratricopeptide repeat protein [Candidatus Elarobacter sp.]|jgi:tetratricopeptide (TPR) repeat protein|nr:tetratricopeptide repeat protein [Candidatus Elarobacter sp.]
MRLLRTIAVAAALMAAQAGSALATETTLIAPGGTLRNDPAVLDAARAKVAAGDTKGAIAGLAPYVADHPQDVAAGRLLGDLYFRVPDYAKAEKIWKTLIAIDAADRETHSRLGALYAVQDRISESMSEFQLSLPSRTGYAGLVMVHKKLGDLQQYMAMLQFETDQHPFNLAKWAELGQAQRALHHYDAALDAFNHVVAIRPSSCSARVDVANALVDLSRIDPAIVHLKACLAVDANYYPAVVNLGEAYLEKNDIVTSRPFLDRALALRPEGPEALVDIGYIYDAQGDWKTAITYYNRAIRSDPLRPEAYIDLGYDYNEHRLFPLAEAAYLKGLAVSQDDGRLHYMLAVTYNLQGKIALARDQYRHAIDSAEPIVVNAAQRELALLPSQ